MYSNNTNVCNIYKNTKKYKILLNFTWNSHHICYILNSLYAPNHRIQ